MDAQIVMQETTRLAPVKSIAHGPEGMRWKIELLARSAGSKAGPTLPNVLDNAPSLRSLPPAGAKLNDDTDKKRAAPVPDTLETNDTRADEAFGRAFADIREQSPTCPQHSSEHSATPMDTAPSIFDVFDEGGPADESNNDGTRPAALPSALDITSPPTQLALEPDSHLDDPPFEVTSHDNAEGFVARADAAGWEPARDDERHASECIPGGTLTCTVPEMPKRCPQAGRYFAPNAVLAALQNPFGHAAYSQGSAPDTSTLTTVPRGLSLLCKQLACLHQLTRRLIA